MLLTLQVNVCQATTFGFIPQGLLCLGGELLDRVRRGCTRRGERGSCGDGSGGAAIGDAIREVVGGAQKEVLQAQADPSDKPNGLGWFQTAMVLEGDNAFAVRSEMAEAWQHADGDRNVAPSPAVQPVSDACTRIVPLGRHAEAKEEASADKGYAALFRAATQEVHAITPNLNDDRARQGLADATADAEVFLVLSKGFNDTTESIPGQGGTNASNAKKLAEMAKDKCKLHIRWFAQDDGTVIDGNGVGASHPKWPPPTGK